MDTIYQLDGPRLFEDEAALFSAVDGVMTELLDIYSALSGHEINTVPFAGSWTPAQLLIHVMKSTRGIVQGIDIPGEPPHRKADARVSQLREVFLNVGQKLSSPEFIRPAPGVYTKADTVLALEQQLIKLREKRMQVNLREEIDFSALGKITRLELLYFILYHTMRHIHQLKNMINCMRN